MLINGQEFKIDRKNARVSEWDKIYCNLLEKIISDGVLVENRTGVSTYSIPNFTFSLENIDKDLPLLESKKVRADNALSEIMWIHQAQTNKVEWLHKRENHIWDDWVIDEDGIYRIYEPKGEYDPEKQVPVMDLDGKVCLDDLGKPLMTGSIKEGRTIKSAKFYGKELAGTIGTAYGWVNNQYKRPQYVLKQLKENPYDRRLNIILWQDAHLKTAVLEPCVWGSEYRVLDGKLNAFIHQRSADVPLGLPFNVIQYSLLAIMFAKVSNLEVGNFSYSIVDAHIYEDQMDGIKLQLDRFKRMEKMETLIQSLSDEKVYEYYASLLLKKEQILERMNNSLNPKEYEYLLREVKEDIMILELMVTKEKPVLELADKDDFFKFSDEFNNDKEYLKENITGNEDVKIKKYKSAPFIRMPVAQ